MPYRAVPFVTLDSVFAVCIEMSLKKDKEEFQLEEQVWMKMKGYPPWPGVVRNTRGGRGRGREGD